MTVTKILSTISGYVFASSPAVVLIQFLMLQTCAKEIEVISTTYTAFVTGVSGLGRLGIAEHSGRTKRTALSKIAYGRNESIETDFGISIPGILRESDVFFWAARVLEVTASMSK